MRNSFFVFFLSSFLISFGQTNPSNGIVDNIVLEFKAYKIDKAKNRIDKLREDKTKKLFLFQWNYIKYGKFKKDLLEKNTSLYSIKERIIYNYLLGDFNKFKENSNDSLAYLYYKKSLFAAKQNNDTLLINEVSRRISKHLFDYKNTNFKEFKANNNLYNFYANDSIDYYWKAYYNVVDKLVKYEQLKETDNLLELDFKLANNFVITIPFLRGKIQQLEGVYYNQFTKEYKKAENHFLRAIELYQKDDYYLSRRGVYENRVNLGASLFNQKKYDKSISVFKKQHEFNRDNLTNLKDELKISNWLSKCYEAMNMEAETILYLKKSDTLKKLINEFEYAIDVKEIEEESVVEEKENKINELKSNNNELSKHLNTLVPLFGFTTLILVLIFYLYKRYKKKSNILEEEQSETLQKLDELKSIVIKNHIVLKDKTKIYVSDLMYIKSDDHYLEIFTQGDKSYTVRGKLSQIKKELPPNFIQCHRSYIINKNFHIQKPKHNRIIMKDGKEIPISRRNKNKF